MYVTGYLQNISGGEYGDVFVAKYSAAGEQVWSRQLDSGAVDLAYALAEGADGTIYVTGQTSGRLDEQTNRGGMDAFVSRFSSDGTRLSTQLFGSSTDDMATGMTVGADGTVFISGSTYGGLVDGEPFQGGGRDALVMRLAQANDGRLSKQWTKLLGSNGVDEVTDVTVGSDGSTYLTGRANGNFDGQTASTYLDTFVAKYNPDGTKAYSRLLGGTGVKQLSSIAATFDSSLIVTGMVAGSYDGQTTKGVWDGFVTKLRSDGSTEWSQMIATSSTDQINAVASAADGSVFVAGYSGGDLSTGQVNSDGLADWFISKYNSDGTTAWTRQSKGSGIDTAKAIAVGSYGTTYVVGYSESSINGQQAQGYYDAFISKYAADGTTIWTRMLGGSQSELAEAVTVGLDGSVYVGGLASSNLDGQTSNGSTDAFITKYSADGVKQWTRLMGSSGWDRGSSLATGSDGSIYLSGYAGGNIDGQTAAAGGDAFIARFNPDGVRLSTQFLGIGAQQLPTGGSGIVPGVDNFFAGRNFDSTLLPSDFDWRSYLAAYPDLGQAGIDTEIEAKRHYTMDGFDRLGKQRAPLEVGRDGTVYVGGYATDGVGGQKNTNRANRYFVTQLSSDGSQRGPITLLGADSTNATWLISGPDGISFGVDKTSLAIGGGGSLYFSGTALGTIDGKTLAAGFASGSKADPFITEFKPNIKPKLAKYSSVSLVNEQASTSSIRSLDNSIANIGLMLGNVEAGIKRSQATRRYASGVASTYENVVRGIAPSLVTAEEVASKQYSLEGDAKKAMNVTRAKKRFLQTVRGSVARM